MTSAFEDEGIIERSGKHLGNISGVKIISGLLVSRELCQSISATFRLTLGGIKFHRFSLSSKPQYSLLYGPPYDHPVSGILNRHRITRISACVLTFMY